MTATSLKLGLDFRRSQARILKRLSDEFHADGHHEHVQLFALAAEAARTGEPLIVECENALEAKLMAAGFTEYPGVEAPTIRELSR